MLSAIRSVFQPTSTSINTGITSLNPPRPWTEADIRADLADWQARELAAGNSQGNVQIAVERILSAWKKRETELDLRDLELRSLPASIGQLKKLTGLWLGGNKIHEVPDWISELQRLQKLDLENNQLKELPEGLRLLKKLTELWLSNNQLKEVPGGLRQLTALKRLYLNDNQIHAGSLSCSA